MKVNKRILLIGVLLGLVTVFFLNRYINSLGKSEVAAATSFVDVVVAAKSIPEHVKITEDMVTISSVPDESLHPDAFTTLDKVVGGISRSEIIKGEQILSGRIASDEIKATLSYQIPENMRAMTIPVNEVSGVANYIDVGDKVDIIATYSLQGKDGTGAEKDVSMTYTQLQNIEVIALGSLKAHATEETEDKVEIVEQPSTITILLNPDQAEVVAWATVNGSFHLTLRSPIDNNKIQLNHYGNDNFESFRAR